MPNRYPIIRLTREPKQAKRIKGPRPGGFPSAYPYARQAQRLGKKLDSVAKNLLQLEEGINVAGDPRAVVPERALVLELLGPVRDFELAAQALGFEWLASVAPRDDEGPVDEEDEDGDEPDKQDIGVLYLTMPTLDGLTRLLAAWRRFKDGKEPTQGEKPLWSLFGYLKDLRTWSAQDRVDPAIIKYVTALLTARPDKPVKVEIDLWYRNESEKRDAAVSTLTEFVKTVKGQLLDLVEIPEIRYQGALIQIPAKVALQLMEQTGDLPNLKEVMTIRPQAAFEPAPPEEARNEPIQLSSAGVLKECVAAVLDGYPVTEHVLLKDRLVVVESEITGAMVPVSARHHGTAMASLILHGDLQHGPETIVRKLAVVPVLGLQSSTAAESTPETKLAIGVVHRALLKLADARKKGPALRNVVVVNHAICDTNAPFVRRPSPWAALLDHFSHAHQLLFVVSAGNIFEPFPCAEFEDNIELAKATDAEREAGFLVAIEKSKGTRGLYSPAESVNALTVGALHADGAPVVGPGEIDPFRLGQMTSLISAVGLGVNRSVKPDLVHDGGRFLARTVDIPGGGVNVFPIASANVGQLVASPSRSGDLRHVARCSGTSNAAALVTRSCIHIADSLEEVFSDDDEDWLAQPTKAVILKALAVHGCSWGERGRVLDVSFPPPETKKWNARRTTITRFLGFGHSDASRVLNGAPTRATLLGEGVIKPDQLHEYRLPIPAAILNNREMRRLVLTLAWTTPIITTIADYRGVTLDIVDQDGKRKFWTGVKKPEIPQPPGKRSGQQGTLQHLILEAKSLQKDFADKSGMFIGVQARERHPSQKDEQVPYALAVTIELSQSLQAQSKLYEQVRDAVRAKARTRTRVRS